MVSEVHLCLLKAEIWILLTGSTLCAVVYVPLHSGRIINDFKKRKRNAFLNLLDPKTRKIFPADRKIIDESLFEQIISTQELLGSFENIISFLSLI